MGALLDRSRLLLGYTSAKTGRLRRKNQPRTLLSDIAINRKQSIRLLTNDIRAIMKSKLRVIEIRKDKEIDLPDNAIPVRLEQVIEPTGLVNPAPSSERYVLYYLEKER